MSKLDTYNLQIETLRGIERLLEASRERNGRALRDDLLDHVGGQIADLEHRRNVVAKMRDKRHPWNGWRP